MSESSNKYNNRVYDLFVSWNHLDQKTIENIYIPALKAGGIDFYYSNQGDTTGDLDNIPSSIVLSTAFTIILSKKALPSKWCLAEFLHAYKTFGINRILPVCIDNVFKYAYSEEVERVDDDGENRTHVNRFCPSLYDSDSNEIDPDFNEPIKNIHAALEALWNKFGTLYQEGKTTICEDFINGIRNIVLEAHLQIFIDDKEKFDIKQLIGGQVNINTDEDLYISRTLLKDDDKEIKEDEIIDLLKERNNLLIVASAGSGKTELLKNIKNKLQRTTDMVALFFECSAYAQSGFKTIFDYMYHCIDISIKTKFNTDHLKGLLEVRDIVIFFDGFDEIVNPLSRAEFIKALEALRNTDGYRVQYVLSSRFADFDDLSLDFKQLYLLGFTDEEIDQYVNSLYLKIDSDDKNREAFYVELHAIDKEIKENPLFLSQLVLIYKKESYIPKTRFEILEKTAQYIVQLDIGRDLYSDKDTQQMMIITISHLLPYLAFHTYYQKIDDPITKYIKDEFGLKDGPRLTFERTKIIEFLESRSLYVNGKVKQFLQIFIDYYSAEYLYREYFKQEKSLDDIVPFVDKYSLMSMLICKIDKEEHDKVDIYKQHITSLYGLGVDSEVFFNITSNLYAGPTTKSVILLENLKTTINAKDNYYHKQFYLIYKYNLDDVLIDVFPLLINQVDSTILISLVRDYFVIAKGIRKGAYLFSEDVLNIVKDIILNNKTYRNALNALFYEITIDYIDDFIDENSRAIHPFFFNLYLMSQEDERDMLGDRILSVNYVDELGIYSHEIVPNTKQYGFISTTYNYDFISKELKHKNAIDVFGLILNNGDSASLRPLPIISLQIAVFVIPSGIETYERGSLDVIAKQAHNSSLYIEYGAKKIEQVNGAFFETIYLPNSVISINVNFEYSNVKSIYFSNNLFEIPERAFCNSKLEYIKLPNNVKFIGCQAFAFTNLKHVDLPTSLEEIDLYAFDCRLDYLFVPSGVKCKTFAIECNFYELKTICFEDAFEDVLNNGVNISDYFNHQDVNLFFGVHDEILVKGNFVLLKQNNELILISQIKYRPYSLIPNEIDGISIKAININALVKMNKVIALNGDYQLIKPNETELVYYHLDAKEKYGAEIILLNTSLRTKDFLTFPNYDYSLFIKANWCLFENNILYYSSIKPVCRIAYIYIDGEITIPQTINYDGEEYKVYSIEENALTFIKNRSLYAPKERFLLHHERNVVVSLTVPSTVRLFEKQEEINKRLGYYSQFIYTDDIEKISETWKPEILNRVIGYEPETIEEEKYKGNERIEYIEDKNQEATVNYLCTHGEKEIRIPKTIQLNGHECVVTKIDLDKDSIVNLLEKLIIPDTIRCVRFNDLKHKIQMNKYKGGHYLGNDKNPYVVIVDVDKNLKELELHEDTRSISLSNAKKAAKVLLNSNISYISIIGGKNINLYYDGRIEDYLTKVKADNFAVNNVKEFYYRDSNQEWVPLAKLTIPSNVKSINPGLFFGLQSLEELVIEDGVTNISYSAFNQCPNLKKIYLPNTLTNIEQYALYLKQKCEIYFHGNILDWSKIKISGSAISLNTTIYFYIDDKYQTLEELHLPINEQEVSIDSFKCVSSIKRVYLHSNFDFKKLESSLNNVDAFFIDQGVKIENMGGNNVLVPVLFYLGDGIAKYTNGEFHNINENNFINMDGICYVLFKNYACLAYVYEYVDELIIPDFIEYHDKKYPVEQISFRIAPSVKAFKKIRIPNCIKNMLLYGNKDLFNKCESYNEDELGNRYFGNEDNPYLVLFFIKEYKKIIKIKRETKVLWNVIVPDSYFLIPKDLLVIKPKHSNSFTSILLFEKGSPLFDPEDPQHREINTIDNVIEIDNSIYCLDGDEAHLLQGVSYNSFYDVPSTIHYLDKSYTVTKIYEHALWDNKYSVVRLPNTIKEIEIGAINFDAHIIKPANLKIKDEDLLLHYTCWENDTYVSNDGLIFIKYGDELSLLYDSNNKDIIEINSSYDNYKVTKIESSFFTHYTSTVYIPNSVKAIDFPSEIKTNLKIIYFNGSLEEWLTVRRKGRINGPLFDYNYIPVFALDKSNKFYSISNEKIITVPHGVETINRMSFLGLPFVEEIHLPPTTIKLDDQCFLSMTSLNRVIVDVNASIKYIGNFILSGDYLITELSLPERIDFIEPHAFSGCGLKTIDLPIHFKTRFDDVEEEIEDGDILHIRFKK